MSKKGKHKKVIGKDDIVDFPKFKLSQVKVKIDSGAYSSSIHCSVIEKTENGLEVVFLEPEDDGYTGETISFKKFKLKEVRSSNGEQEQRYIIRGNVILFNRKYNTDFSLTKRDLMRYPVLLGRKLLSKRFLIDTSLTNQSYNFKQKEKEKNENRDPKSK